MSRPADWRQRAAGRDPERSFIVQAPAGSGKTELLTQRLLGLLARVEHPEEVVAITFTRKAAAEMAHRLLERLQQAESGMDPGALLPHEQTSLQLARDVLANDANWGWCLLEQPGRLRVRTIDSLCSDLSRQLPILSGLGGGQKIADNPEDLYRHAAVRTMSVIENEGDELQSDVARVLSRYDNQYDRLVDLLTGMLASRDQWMEHLFAIRRGGGFDRADMESALQILVEHELQSARRLCPDGLLSTLPRFFRFALCHEPDDEAALRDLLDACGGPECRAFDLPAEAAALPHWRTLIARLMTADGKKWRASVNVRNGFPAQGALPAAEKELARDMKEGMVALLASLEAHKAFFEQLNIVRSLPDPKYRDEAWTSLESLMRILVRATAEWKLVMAESGSADFGEITDRAILALGADEAPSDLALRLDYRIQHLLVDEFQDTSHNQIRLLERLTAGWTAGDGRTLFLVGDPMQSIYRFRKAEVSLFIEAFEGRLFSHVGLTPLTLEVNFRSTRPVVDWVNRVFPNVMPAENDPVNGAVAYSPSKLRPGAVEDGTVELRIRPGRDDGQEADEIVDIIRNSNPEERLAVLVRARNHASELLARLDRLKVKDPRFRYQAIDFNPLGETVLIRDLVSLTLALTQAADRLAWLSVLRAPFSGIDLQDLETLVANDDAATIPDALEAFLERLPSTAISPNGCQRLRRIVPVLLGAASMSGRAPIRSIVEHAWILLGGPACLDNDSQREDAETYFELLEGLEDEGLPVDRDNLDQRLEKLFARPDAMASENLQVMTIHNAKGLQFDTVILPGLNRDTGGDKPRLLHWFELPGQQRIVMSPMRSVEEKERYRTQGDLVQFIAGVEKRRQSLENGRLLYVAATRAKRRLYLLGGVRVPDKGAVRPGAGTLLGQIWPAVADQTGAALRTRAEAPGGEDSGAKAGFDSQHRLPQIHRRLPPEWVAPVAPNPVDSTGVDFSETSEYIEFRWAGENARFSGNLVHRLLQQIAEQGIPAFRQGGGMAAKKDWCRRQLLRDGVTGEKAVTIIERTARAIDRCLASSEARWILEAHEDSHCELALTAMLGEHPVNLVLDRTFVDTGERWIIDYKTSEHAGGDLEGFLDSETDRYREQLSRYRRAMALTESRPIRTALYFPLLDRLVEIEG